MKVDVIIDKKISEAYLVVHTNELTNRIKAIITYINQEDVTVQASIGDKTYILKQQDIGLIRVIDGELSIYDTKHVYKTNKRLYEIAKILGNDFMQISKSSIININHVLSVEASFSGSLKVNLKNGLSDYISRFYVKQFKQYFGL